MMTSSKEVAFSIADYLIEESTGLLCISQSVKNVGLNKLFELLPKLFLSAHWIHTYSKYTPPEVITYLWSNHNVDLNDFCR